MLCRKCQKVFATPPSIGEHNITYGTLAVVKTAARRGCEFCQRLLDRIQKPQHNRYDGSKSSKPVLTCTRFCDDESSGVGRADFRMPGYLCEIIRIITPEGQ